MLIFIWFDWFVLVCLVVGFLGFWQCFLYCLVFFVYLFGLVCLFCLVLFCLVLFCLVDLLGGLYCGFWKWFKFCIVWCVLVCLVFWFGLMVLICLVLFVWFGGLSGVWFGCFWKCYDFLGDLFGAFLCCVYFSWLLKVFYVLFWFGLFVGLVWFSFERRDNNFYKTWSCHTQKYVNNLTLSLLSRED